jgi:hypothetical protein
VAISPAKPALLVFATLVQFGCGNGSGSRNEDNARDNSAGPQITFAGLPKYTIQATARIDGYAADLVPVGWLGVSRTSILAVFQPQDRKIRFFDLSGDAVLSFGGPGEGPGEFRRLSSGGWISDTLWVADGQLNRVTLISAEGRLVRTLPLGPVRPSQRDSARFPPFPRVQALAVYPGDTLLVAAMLPAGDPRGAAFQGTPFLRVSSEGTALGLVLDTPHDPSAVSLNINGMFVTVAVPFAARPLWAVASDGSRIAVVSTNVSESEQPTFDVAAFDARGNELFREKFPFEPTRIPKHVADSVTASWAAAAPRPEVRRAIEAEVRPRVPPVYPPIASVLIGDDGRLWIGLRQTVRGNAWLVLDSDGDAVGWVEFPSNTLLRHADAEHVWAVERDELHVESVVRFRLTGE